MTDFDRIFRDLMPSEQFSAKDMKTAREVAIRQGFELAIRKAASIARQEGYTSLAAKIEQLQLVKK